MGIVSSKKRDDDESCKEITNPGRPTRVLMLGLRDSGKTTILYKMTLHEEVTIIPTIGFNVEKVSPCEDLTMTVWDMNVTSETKVRPLWRSFHHKIDGLIYVIDSENPEKMEESREEFDKILEAGETKGVPLLVLANKHDLPRAEPLTKIIDRFGLQSMERPWHIQASCAINGKGIFEGMQKLADMMKVFKRNRYN